MKLKFLFCGMIISTVAFSTFMDAFTKDNGEFLEKDINQKIISTQEVGGHQVLILNHKRWFYIQELLLNNRTRNIIHGPRNEFEEARFKEQLPSINESITKIKKQLQEQLICAYTHDYVFRNMKYDFQKQAYIAKLANFFHIEDENGYPPVIELDDMLFETKCLFNEKNCMSGEFGEFFDDQDDPNDISTYKGKGWNGVYFQPSIEVLIDSQKAESLKDESVRGRIIFKIIDIKNEKSTYTSLNGVVRDLTKYILIVKPIAWQFYMTGRGENNQFYSSETYRIHKVIYSYNWKD